MTTLDELKRLERDATPEPWETTTWDGLLFVASVQQLQGTYVCELGMGSDGAQRDAALIAAARNALPALLRVAGIAQEVRAALHLNGVDTEAMRESLEDIEERLAAALAALEAAS